MDIKKQMIGIRTEYIDSIRRELLGPGSESEFSVYDAEHELITSSPEKRYSVGILYPKNNAINSENTESIRVEETENSTDDEDDSFIDKDTILNFDDEDLKEQNTNSFDPYVDENLDEEIGLASQNFPSSMGITFVIKGSSNIIRGEVSFATYRKSQISDCKVPYRPDNPNEYSFPSAISHIMKYEKESSDIKLLTKTTGKDITQIFKQDLFLKNDKNLKHAAYHLISQLRSGYVREPHKSKFELDFSQSDYIDNNQEISDTNAKITALRRKIGEDVWSITVMLVNTCEERASGINCLFQPQIMFSSSENSFVFCEYGANSDISAAENEEQSLALLYRKKRIYGSGLGTSANWKIDDEGKGKIFSDFFPEVEVPPMDFDLPENETVSKDKLSMKYLSDLDDTDKSEKLQALKGIVALYSEWIDKLGTEADNLDKHYRSAAESNVSECRRARDRMYAGIKTLESNDNAWNAFVLANRAMFMQREQLHFQAQTGNIERYPDDAEIETLLSKIDYRTSEDSHRWRPFQIAFILMDIDSIVYDDCHDRDLVDLIWFPTGGGKTEAYLGLTAFVIFFRRLAHLDKSNGTAVIMRYTLRLLTAQQFTRASTLICACEFIRRDCSKREPRYPFYPLGEKEISIGLWIGGEHTPNNNKIAQKHLDELLKVTSQTINYKKERYNKFQVLKCPWCGTKLVKDEKDGKLIGQWGYKMRNNRHFYMSCPNESCDFNDRLPIQIVDEELYENPPSLLFGTVDKFAMLPWESSIGSFFAVHNDNRAPELIIQDELHLISGPLGTIVGLYETVIDALCKAKGVNPKIIASTATIRHAKEQCSVLYNRDVVQFPPPGLNSDDSFFSRESQISHEKGVYGRKYVGLIPAGKTKAMMEARSLAALLQKAEMMKLEDDIKDKIWTLTVYFNSLRDLGKCSSLIADDVKDFIIRMSYRLGTQRRSIVGSDELTSRVTNTELNATLDKLEKLEYSQENIANNRYASNVLLATNMISVGIDIARLNVMLIVGQPKLTSEYIQASSRVGRQYPGVVFVLYDGSKSRDRSHFEQFRAYHESFYRSVEPTGATPFSKPARDRALHAVITAMLRYSAGWTEDIEASKFNKDNFAENIKKIKDFIIKRVKEINKRADVDLADESSEIETEIDKFLDEWNRMASSISKNEELYFGKKFMFNPPDKNKGEKRLLKVFGTDDYDISAFDTLTSMRNVDTPVNGELLNWEE